MDDAVLSRKTFVFQVAYLWGKGPGKVNRCLLFWRFILFSVLLLFAAVVVTAIICFVGYVIYAFVPWLWHIATTFSFAEIWDWFRTSKGVRDLTASTLWATLFVGPTVLALVALHFLPRLIRRWTSRSQSWGVIAGYFKDLKDKYCTIYTIVD